METSCLHLSLFSAATRELPNNCPQALIGLCRQKVCLQDGEHAFAQRRACMLDKLQEGPKARGPPFTMPIHPSCGCSRRLIRWSAAIQHSICQDLPCSTLQYAGDTLIICQAEERHVLALKDILLQISDATSLCINYSKSSMVFLHVPLEEHVRLVGLL